MKWSIVLGLILVSQLALAGDMVSYQSADEKVQAYLARPQGNAPFPAMILIHEWWGLNEQIKEVADRLAKEGYMALAVDLYRGKVTADPGEANQYMASLPEDRAIRDLKAAFSYLQQHPEVNKDRIGVIGWCMGGKWAAQLALHQPNLTACVIYYGSLPTDPQTLERFQCPVIGFFGEADQAISPKRARSFEAQMKKLGKPVSVHIYPGAGHGFANETGKNYDASAAQDAWARTLAFLAQYLKP